MIRRTGSSIFLLALATAVGCSSTPQPPANEAPAATPTTAATAAPTAAATAAPTAAQKIDPKTPEDCKLVAQASTGDDPAAAGQGTGDSDRKNALTDLIK